MGKSRNVVVLAGHKARAVGTLFQFSINPGHLQIVDCWVSIFWNAVHPCLYRAISIPTQALYSFFLQGFEQFDLHVLAIHLLPLFGVAKKRIVVENIPSYLRG